MKTEQRIKQEILKIDRELEKVNKLPDNAIVILFGVGLPTDAKQGRHDLIWMRSTLKWVLLDDNSN